MLWVLSSFLGFRALNFLCLGFLGFYSLGSRAYIFFVFLRFMGFLGFLSVMCFLGYLGLGFTLRVFKCYVFLRVFGFRVYT